MTSKLTREETQQIIDAADAVITALAGTNDEVHKDDNGKMIGLWDDLNDRYAPPVVVRELARMALAAMDSEPVAWLAIYHGEVYDEAIGITRSVVEAQADHFGWELALTEIIPLYRHAQPAPVLPKDVMPGGLVYSSALPKFESNDSDKVVGYYCFISEKTRIVEIQEQAYADAKAVLNAFRAAMLQHQPQNAPQNIPGGLVEAVNNLLNNDGSRGCYDAMECSAAREKIELWLAQCQRWEEQRKANLSAGNSPVIPDGYVMVPIEPTAEMQSAGASAIRFDTTAVNKLWTGNAVFRAMLAAALQEVKEQQKNAGGEGE